MAQSKSEQKSEKKAYEKLKSKKSFWERINSDPDFIKAKRNLQARHGLASSFHSEYFRSKNSKAVLIIWKPKEQKVYEVNQPFLDDAEKLLADFSIPLAWHNDFIRLLAGISVPEIETVDLVSIQFKRDENGNKIWQAVITPETDLNDPMVIETIQRLQRQHAGDPPKPIKDKINPRKYDWRPTYEWYKKYKHLFTIEDIAKKINYTPHRVRLKLAELENDK